MQRKAGGTAIPGSTPVEKMGFLGILPGKKIDIRRLGTYANSHGIEITLFFEEDLARSRTIESVQQEFSHLPEYERPYVDVNAFLRFTRENDPSFEATLEEFPLMIEIVSIGEKPARAGTPPSLFATGIMPFLDEFDVNVPPPEPTL